MIPAFAPVLPQNGGANVDIFRICAAVSLFPLTFPHAARMILLNFKEKGGVP